MTHYTVFVSYSHKDENKKDQLLTHLGVLEHIAERTKQGRWRLREQGKQQDLL